MHHIIGFIYIRTHPNYDAENACKLGKTNNIPERDTQYATGEIKRGCFNTVFEVPIEKMSIIERLLQYKFRELNIRYNGGTEFYNKQIIILVEPYLQQLGVEYKKLTPHEIDNLTRCNRVRQIIKKINIQSFITELKKRGLEKRTISLPAKKFTPRDDQKEIIEKATTYFQQHDKGILVLMCGVGKTLISLWITQQMQSDTIIIGVPNKLLLKQWEQIISEIFDNIPCLMVSSGMTIDKIARFLKDNKKCIVITTYASTHKVYKAAKQDNFTFDMKINDEVHHLTSSNIIKTENKTYINMLKIASKKQISLTATLKLLENNGKCNNNDVIISNDNKEHFGDIIDKKSLLWAINNNIICDYVVQTIITKDDQLEQHLIRFNIKEENDKRLFLSAFASLKSIYDNHSHHLLVYSNSKENALKIIQYIKMLLDDNYFSISNLYYSVYHSELKSQTQRQILNCFEKSSFGIISCVYCLGEGWDFPLLDGVVFAENMTSNIRIVQSALRASRRNNKDISKKSKIILPILNNDDWLENGDSNDLKKVKEVVYQIGLEDETIEQKLKVFRIDVGKQGLKENITTNETINELGEYDDTLTQKLRLNTINRAALSITYEKARVIIRGSGNIRSKQDYYDLCERDIRLTREPEITYKGKFTNWIDYLSIDRVYYDLETCKGKVREYLLTYPCIKRVLELSDVCSKICKLDPLFPPNGLWVEYYNVKDLQNIIEVVNTKKKVSISL